MLNLKYNNITPEQKGCWLASKPVLTHSEIKRNRYDIPMHDAEMYEVNMYRGVAQFQILFHMSSDTYAKSIRTVRQWLQGDGVLEFTDEDDAYYEVLEVAQTEDYRKSDDYGRLNTVFYVYPYEFMKSGNTAKTGNTQTINNQYDLAKPLYKVSGTGSGTLTVNGMPMILTSISGEINIDTRRQTARDGNNNPADNKISGDYTDLFLNNGLNTVSLTVSSGSLSLSVYPKWGYVI